MIRPPPISPLFPYPTLSRSRPPMEGGELVVIDIGGGSTEFVVGHGRGDVAFFTSLQMGVVRIDRKSTRLNSSHANISYAVFCLKKKKRSLLYSTRYHPTSAR